MLKSSRNNKVASLAASPARPLGSAFSKLILFRMYFLHHSDNLLCKLRFSSERVLIHGIS